MGKFWLRLLGIGEEEEADLSRRGFLKMLGGTAVVTAVAPTYVFAPSGGWNEGIQVVQTIPIVLDNMEWIVPALADNFFKPSPIFTRLMTQADTKKRFSTRRQFGEATWNLR